MPEGVELHSPHRPVTVRIFDDVVDGVSSFDPLRGSEFTDINFANVLTFLSGSISRRFFVILGKRCNRDCVT